MKASTVVKMSGAILVAGILFGVGQRIGQWLVPAPALEISLCSPADADGSSDCLSLDDTNAPADAPADAAPQIQKI